ncbi:hypothetical protein ANN_17885 [Periplaneta americana]|uniref:Mos1 transposase HTH domain-containing protein n=1 Tax=Periplaneta americana TaxID=6978 RepID=A0ABQ8SU71_PERAM|nr:hypothetical protein ANN_17885 [Periplaneta americana]
MEAGKEEQRGVVRFLTAEGVGGREIYCRMSAVYSEHSMSCYHVLEWHKRFREGCVSLQDVARPGEAHRAIIPAVIAEVDGLIWGNRLRCLVGINHGSVHVIATKHLHYRKIYSQGVPHQLTEEQKQTMTASLGHLQRYHGEEYAFLSGIVIGDELWCHHFEVESKWQSQQ